MNDLTLLYYTANTISDACARNVRNHLLEVTGGKFPIVSVSQKPIDFGTNICIGEIGKSHYNCYKQILTGAMVVKTKYVACCEDDTLYNQEYFSHRPSGDDIFAYNLNWWYAEAPCFWHKMIEMKDTGMCQCLCPTNALIENLKVRFDVFSNPIPASDRPTQKCWQEPGRDDVYFGIPNAKFEYFSSERPTIVFNYRGSLGGKRKSWRPTTFADSLPGWGKAKDLWQKYWEVKL
ncbi:hypothetical protein MUO65_04070 [bacterium]|nr:hypothetical protein [bacterium]